MKKTDPAKAITGRILTTKLLELANGIIEDDLADDGSPITRVEKLAGLVWKMALGYTELLEKGDKGGATEVIRPPSQWAISLLFDRFEGRVSQMLDDGKIRPSLGKRISERGKQKINRLSGSQRTISRNSGDVDLPDNGS